MKPMLCEPGALLPLSALDSEQRALPEVEQLVLRIDQVRDPRFGLSQKIDGHRRMVVVRDGKPTGINRTGGRAALPDRVARQFTMEGEWTFDGELLGETLWLFDVIEANGKVGTTTPWELRRGTLDRFFSHWGPAPCVRLLPWFRETEDKAELVRRVHASKGEGVIASRLDGNYHPGLRAQAHRKFKFVKDIDCFVTRKGLDGKDNFEVAVFNDAGDVVVVGEVGALTADGPRVQVNDVVTVRYLTWTGNRLREPTLPKLRTDKAPEECLFDQLAVGNTREVLV